MNWWKDKETAARNLWNALGMIISSPQQPKIKMRYSNKRQRKKKKEKVFLWWPTQYIIWVFLFFPPIHSISFYDRQWCFQWSAIPVHQRLYTSEASIIRPVIHKENDRKCERQTSCTLQMSKILSALHLSGCQVKLPGLRSIVQTKKNMLLRHTAVATLHLELEMAQTDLLFLMLRPPRLPPNKV